MGTKKWKKWKMKKKVKISKAEELTQKSQKKSRFSFTSEERRKRFIYLEELETKALAVLKFLLSHGLVYAFLHPGPGALFAICYLNMAASISLTDSVFYHTGFGMYSDKLDSRSNFRFYGSLVCMVALLSIFFGHMYMTLVGLIGSCVVYVGELLIVLKFFNIKPRLNGQHSTAVVNTFASCV